MPDVLLGPTGPGSIAATTWALVERGCLRRPELAARLPPTTRIVFAEPYPAVRISAAAGVVTVGDDDLAPAAVASLELHASLPDLVAMLTVPLRAGVPSPLTAEGRAVIRALAAGRVRMDGLAGDGLRLLRLLSLLD